MGVRMEVHQSGRLVELVKKGAPGKYLQLSPPPSHPLRPIGRQPSCELLTRRTRPKSMATDSHPVNGQPFNRKMGICLKYRIVAGAAGWRSSLVDYSWGDLVVRVYIPRSQTG